MEQSPGRNREVPIVRPYRAEDRAAVRRICADTGFLGKPIDPVFEDRELFADYLTGYYTDAEPESTYVTLMDGEVKGYMMGSRFPKRKARYEAARLPLLAIRGAWRYVTRPYNAASRKYVRWILTQARHEVPFAPPDMAHIHFNILPEAQGVRNLREIVERYMAYLVEHGEKKVYGQVVSYGAHRGERLFARYGFQVINRREMTKYRDFYPGRVELLTVVKDLEANPFIYGLDLHKQPPSAMS
jgi:hypothetical protein